MDKKAMSAPLLLLGNQNAGKTTLFNALTGLNAKVANYPGVTVEARVGEITRFAGEKVSVVDLPGTYSLIPTSEEEELTVKALLGEIPQLAEHSLVVVVIDCTELRRGLYLYSQVIELGFKAIIALSMVDQRPELWRKEAIVSLQKAVGSIVVPLSATDKASIKKLANTIDGVLAGSLQPQVKKQPLLFSSLSESLQHKLKKETALGAALPPHARHSADLIGNHHVFLYGLVKRGRLNKTAKDLAHVHLSPEDIKELDLLLSEIPEQRFSRVDSWLVHLKIAEDRTRAKSDFVDRILLQPMVGSLFLISLFIFMLQALFLLARPLADAIDDGISYLGYIVSITLPQNSMVTSLVVEGIFEGVGSILSFLPLIALLFLFLSILEDSGYLARATYLLDAILKRMGLCGRSLMPMLSGFACAVPAIMAARTIGNRKERLITILVTPFLTCSARLPVFGLIVGALFSSYPPLFGIFDVGALMFVAMYMLGLFASLLSAAVLSKIIKADASPSLAIELPHYRFPNPFSIIKRVIDRIYLFIRDVGSVILASTIIIWALFHFEPFSKPSSEVVVHDLSHTYAGMIGRSIEPFIAPMGLDWQVGVGIVASFLAREVFVSTMAVVYGLSSPDEEDVVLKTAFKNHVTPLAGFCLLIFFTLSMQCISTMATTKRETGSFFWPLLQFFMMSGSGYVLSVMVYNIGRFFGLS
jgi:ferrous iron transport protein B